MRRLILILISVLFLVGCSKNIDTITKHDVKPVDILTLMSSKSDSSNKVWIGTFQIAFNEIKNKIIKHDIKFINEPMTDELKGLNSEEFNSDMLNDSSYYVSVGETSIEAKNKIKKDIKSKFNETIASVIDELNWQKEKGKYYAYVMLKKEFEFLKEFNKLENDSFNNSSEKYKYFGIEKGDDSDLSSNVKVLFYNNKDDYAVKLNTKNSDGVYLYRTDSNDDFKTIYSKMLSEAKNSKNTKSFDSNKDSIKIPFIKLNETNIYYELMNKVIKDSDLMISHAIETIELELNQKGGKVKSEAIIMTVKSAYMPKEEIPREFNFNKTFVMFLVDSGKSNPYFALRIKDLKDFQ